MKIFLVAKNHKGAILYKKLFTCDKIEEDENTFTARLKNQDIAFFFSKKILEKRSKIAFFVNVDSINANSPMVGLINEGLKGIINLNVVEG